MLKISKLAFRGSLVFTAVSLIFLFGMMGCEQILDEALKKQVSVEEPLFDSETHENANDQKVAVTDNFSLGSSNSSLAKMTNHAFNITPDNNALFNWVCSEGGGALQGALENRDANPVTFNVHVSGVNDFATASLIGSVNLAGNQSREFTINGSAFETFFANAFQSGMTNFFLFLSASGSSTVNILVDEMGFALQPSYALARIVGPVSSLTRYIDSIGDISNISLQGSIKNLSPGVMKLLLRVAPVSPGTWKGMQLKASINPGESLDLENWSGLLTEAELQELESALRYLGTNSMKAELLMTTAADMKVEIISIVLSGSVSVAL